MSVTQEPMQVVRHAVVPEVKDGDDATEGHEKRIKPSGTSPTGSGPGDRPAGQRRGEFVTWNPRWSGVAVAVLAVAVVPEAAAQPRATAFLRPVETARLELNGAADVINSDRADVCLDASAYIIAVRIEPGYVGTVWVGRPDDEDNVEDAWVFIDRRDGRRWGWQVFESQADGTCFSLVATVSNPPQGEALARPALRAQVYSVRVAVDW